MAIPILSEFYCVYILQSIHYPRSTYIGSTPDIKKRLRQHNGEIVGGAHKTRNKRPWKVILIVYGFTSKITALQFEHSLQHSYQTRLIGEKITKRKGSSSLHQIFANIKILLCSFHRLNVCIFDEDTRKIWEKNRYNLDSIRPEFQSFDSFQMEETELLHIPKKKCNICDKSVNDVFGICKDHVFHLPCLARRSSQLIPDEIQCECGETIIWKHMVKQSLFTIHHDSQYRN